MALILIPDAETTPEAARPVLDAIEQQLGVVPNLYRLMANSPQVLSGFTAFAGALAKTLDLKTHERIALAVAQVNGCDYCLSAHTYLALNLAKLSREEVEKNRRGGSGDAKADAAVKFSTLLARQRGHVTEADLAGLRGAGFGEKEIVEIIAVVAQNCFTNFLNVAAKTDIDFPLVLAAEAA